MDALFTAFDISGLTTNVTTILLAGVALLALSVGWKKLRQTGKSV